MGGEESGSRGHTERSSEASHPTLGQAGGSAAIISMVATP